MDSDGNWFVPGYIIAPGCDETLSEDRFYHCPLSDLISEGPVREIIDTHRKLSLDGVQLCDLVSSPTAALLDGLVELDSTLESYRNVKQLRAQEEAARKAGR